MILPYSRSEAAELGSAHQDTMPDLRFIVDAASVEESIKTPKPRLSSARDLLHAVRSLTTAMSRRSGRRHLVLVDDGSCEAPQASLLQEIVGVAKAAGITIHGISQCQTA